MPKASFSATVDAGVSPKKRNFSMSSNSYVEEIKNKIEKWRESAVEIHNIPSQYLAFKLSILAEEKIRVFALTSGIEHEDIRQTVFSLEWSLRSIQNLPSKTVTREIKIRNKYEDLYGSELINILKNFNLFCTLRDLIITTRKGGYTIEKTSDNSYKFIDIPNWIGYEDKKARYFSQYVDDHISNTVRISENIDNSPLKRDFPSDIECGTFSSNDFWDVYAYLWKICYTSRKINYKINKYGVTTKTNKLTILRNIDSLIRDISKEKKISNKKVRDVLNWLFFDKETNYKFTLFHCPLIKLNNNIVLISPISILNTHVPTIFMRLLAHRNKKALDSVSSQLEQLKINELISHMNTNTNLVKGSVKTKIKKKEVEIDLVEFDEAQSTLSLVQAKFFIRPDTVAEVYSSNETIEKAVKQLHRNKKLVENSSLLKQICDLIGISKEKVKTINYILLPTNFVGSDYVIIDKWIQIVPMEFYLLPENKGKSIQQVSSRFRDIIVQIPDALVSVEESIEFAGMDISFPNLSV